MNSEYCQKVRISAMALRDSETAPLSEQLIARHLESCADCRLEIEQQTEAMDLLTGRSRRDFTQDVWPRLSPSLVRRVGRAGQVRQARTQDHAKPEQVASVLPFVALCTFLLIHKIIEVLPSVTAGLTIKLAPVAVLVLFFALIKQNPFEINQNLKLQGDTK